MIQAALFDVYGTIAGWRPSRLAQQKRACATFGLDGAVTPEGIARGYATADAFMAAENANRPIPQRGEPESDAFFAEYERLALEGCGIVVSPERALEIFNLILDEPSSLWTFDDAPPALRALKQAGIVIGLISNIPQRGDALVKELGLVDLVDFAVTSGELGVAKPHPVMFRTALDRAGVGAGEALMVGDQPATDIRGALRVGMSAALIDRDGNHPRFRECPRITTLAELPYVIRALDRSFDDAGHLEDADDSLDLSEQPR